ncbi:MAG: TetR/AcrR family transcriptional regulator [Proteobacteria bacterium]|nr:TetR/AcrR family transcriptional regulator [Pseudomonadota bacterium]
MNTKEKILDGARNYLLNNGQVGFTVRAIAGEAGVNQGLVHHYFGSKEQLILDLIERETNTVLERVREFSTGVKSGEMHEVIVKAMVMNTDFSRLLIEFVNLAQHTPVIKEKVKGVIRSRREFVGELLGIVDTMDMVILQASIMGLLFQANIDDSISFETGVKRVFERMVPTMDKDES